MKSEIFSTICPKSNLAYEEMFRLAYNLICPCRNFTLPLHENTSKMLRDAAGNLHLLVHAYTEGDDVSFLEHPSVDKTQALVLPLKVSWPSCKHATVAASLLNILSFSECTAFCFRQGLRSSAKAWWASTFASIALHTESWWMVYQNPKRHFWWSQVTINKHCCFTAMELAIGTVRLLGLSCM